MEMTALPWCSPPSVCDPWDGACGAFSSDALASSDKWLPCLFLFFFSFCLSVSNGTVIMESDFFPPRDFYWAWSNSYSQEKFLSVISLWACHNSLFLVVDLNNVHLPVEFSKELFPYEMFYFQAMFMFGGLYDVVDILVKQFKMTIVVYASSSIRTLTLRVWDWRKASSRSGFPRRAKNENVRRDRDSRDGSVAYC